MKLHVFERDSRKLVQGIISEKRAGTGAAAGRVVNIKLTAKVYDADTKAEKDETMDIAFWNSETRKLADDANNRLEVGKYVSVLVSEKDGKYSAIAFKKQGVWHFAETLDDAGNIANSEANILIGLVVNGYEAEDGSRYRISMPVTTYDEAGNPSSEWVSITFFSSENQPNLPANAKKVLQPYVPEGSEKPVRHRATIRCGAKKVYTPEDGSGERPSYTGYSFDRLD